MLFKDPFVNIYNKLFKRNNNLVWNPIEKFKNNIAKLTYFDEDMYQYNDEPINQKSLPFAIISFISIIFFFIILLFFGKFLWNRALVPSVTFAKPVNSVYQIIGIYYLIVLNSCIYIYNINFNEFKFK